MKTHTKGVMPWDVAHRVISCHRVSSSHSSIGGDRFNIEANWLNLLRYSLIWFSGLVEPRSNWSSRMK